MSFRISTASLSRASLTDITRRQEAIAEAREQIASGKRINRPSDDPAQAAQLRELDTARSRLTQYERNASMAQTRLAVEESTLGSMGDTLNRIRELTVQAANDSNGPAEREAIAVEIEGRLAGLYELANVRDAGGDALFAGSRGAAAPFSPPAPGDLLALYSGDDIERRISLGTERSVVSAHTGGEAFLRIRAGNGDFEIQPAAINTGTGRVDAGHVVDGAAWTETDYTITFTSPASFDITEAGGTVVQSGAAYAPGAGIEFAGVRIAIEGEPAAGDTFELAAGAERDLFGRVADLVDALRAPADTDAQRAAQQQGMQSGLAALDGAMEHLGALRAGSGMRLQTVEASREESAALALQLDTTIASMRDADLTETIVRLESETRALEVLQKAHARLSGISILDHL